MMTSVLYCSSLFSFSLCTRYKLTRCLAVDSNSPFMPLTTTHMHNILQACFHGSFVCIWLLAVGINQLLLKW